MNPRPVLRILGRLLLVLALAELCPVVVCLAYGERSAAIAFVQTAVLSALVGAFLAGLGRGARQLYRREGILIVVGGWALASAFGALPYILTGTTATFVDALFESASGFTTTGASILTDIQSSGRGILFWRSFSQWLGGMGIIVLFVALLPELGPGARFLYRLEVPGPTAETLHPRVHDTAAVLWQIYLLLTVAQAGLLMLSGLDLYDALTHSFSTLSTGGFSPWNDSVAAFHSPLVEVIVVVFMILAGVNFSLYYGLRRRGRWNLLGDPELRIYLLITFVVSGLVAWNLMAQGGYVAFWRALLDATFQVVSILTTTGFATADFDRWPDLSRTLLVLLMFVGGCAGSTSGGAKVMRYVIAFKAALREVRLIFSPSAVLPILVGGTPVPNSVARSVSGYFFLYFASWGLGALLLTFGVQGLETSATASIAILGNIGPGLSAVGPTQNFAFFDSGQKLAMVLLMWLGRLEVYSIVALFTFSYWRR